MVRVKSAHKLAQELTSVLPILPGELGNDTLDVSDIGTVPQRQANVSINDEEDIIVRSVTPSVRGASKEPSVRGASKEPSGQLLDLLDTILSLDAHEIIWIVNEIKAHKYPDLLRSSTTTFEDLNLITPIKSISRFSTIETTDVSDEQYWKVDLQLFPPIPSSKQLDNMPTVQFSSFMYFCVEGESNIKINVMRFGNVEGRSVVPYCTVDATAKAGRKYVAVEGALEFEPGQTNQEISVEILQNDRWETTLDFEVHLTQEGLTNAVLGRYLHTARVTIIDDDAFPTNKYKELVSAGDIENVPQHSLLLEYFKMTWADRGIRRRTIKMILAAQIKNLIYFSELFLRVYLVDYVLNTGHSEVHLIFGEDRLSNLIAVVLLTLIPCALIHAFDYKRCRWALGAGALQRNLLRKFLNYDLSSRAQLREANLIMGMARDANKLMHSGFSQLVPLSQSFGKLFAIVVYQFTSPFIFNQTDMMDALSFIFSFAPLILLPAILITFMIWRQTKSTRLLADVNSGEDEVINWTHHTAENYRLIADYGRRPLAVQYFSKVIAQWGAAWVQSAQVQTNNIYFQRWITNLLVAIVTLFLGINVYSTGYPLGMFLANVRICGNLGRTWGEIYEVLMNMEKTLPALSRVTWLMNLSTDVGHRMQLQRAQESKTLGDGPSPTIDSLSITLQNIPFAYKGNGGVERAFEFKGRIDIRQGSLVALVGNKGQGKTTLLKIIAGVNLPPPNFKEGQVFIVPSHLRMLHVSTEPMFFHTSLYDNLIYGVQSAEHPDADKARVNDICRVVGLPTEVKKHMLHSEPMDWVERFSETQLSLLTLARAIIANPEVLCVQKPTLFLDVKASHRVLQLLRSFVDQKGICQDPGTIHMRRPRTCICTASRHEALKLANQVYLVQLGHVEEIPWQNVTPDLLQ